jgi:hypothetical protein
MVSFSIDHSNLIEKETYDDDPDPYQRFNE